MKGFNAALLRTMAVCASFVVAGRAVADVTELPADIQASLYNPALLDPNQPIGDSAYRDFVAKETRRRGRSAMPRPMPEHLAAAVMDRLQNEIIPKWQKLGLLSEVIVTQSNLNDATQIQQMRQLVDQGVDAIIVCCSNPTALNATVWSMPIQGRAGVFGIGYLTSPYSINSSANFAVGGNMLASGWRTRSAARAMC